jgi:hypothetical protein
MEQELDKEFVSYEIALQMKELGFIEECFSYYDLRNKPNFFGSDTLMDTHCVQVNRPTYSQCFRFFREKYNLDSFVKNLYKSTIKVGYYFGIDKYKGVEFQMDIDDWYDTYEEAELACLDKLIEIIKLKK